MRGVRPGWMSQPRSKDQLARALADLDYEYTMLTAVARAMGSGIAAQSLLNNALLESFVIHFRALLDFFYPQTNAKADDVLATDFFNDPTEWERVRPSLSDVLKRGRTRAHKEIAHLTYARQDVTSETKPWPFAQIANEIENLMQLFRAAISGRFA